MDDDADVQKAAMLKRIERAREVWRSLDKDTELQRALRMYRREILTPPLPPGLERKKIGNDPLLLPQKEPHSLESIRSLWSPKGSYPHFTIDDEAALSQQLSIVHEAREMRHRLGFASSRQAHVRAVWTQPSTTRSKLAATDHRSADQRTTLKDNLSEKSISGTADPDLSPITACAPFPLSPSNDMYLVDGSSVTDPDEHIIAVGDQPEPRRSLEDSDIVEVNSVLATDPGGLATQAGTRNVFPVPGTGTGTHSGPAQTLHGKRTTQLGDEKDEVEKISTRVFSFLEEYVALRTKHLQ